MSRRVVRYSAMVPLLWIGAALLTGAYANSNPYEMTSRAQVVVSVRVLAGSLKRAKVVVEKVFKGPVESGDLIHISFRDFNLDLDKENRIEFEDGESYLLFLDPETNLRGEAKRKDRFVLFRGSHGKISLPREGAGVYLEAMETLAQLSRLKDHRELYSRLQGLIRETNPLLLDTGLGEIARLHLMEARMVPEVLPLLRDASPAHRAGALGLLAQLFASPEERDQAAGLEERVVGVIQVLGRNDPSEEVRVAAVRALGVWGEEGIEETLKEIAAQDPAQAVRYEAQLILLRGVGKGRGSPHR